MRNATDRSTLTYRIALAAAIASSLFGSRPAHAQQSGQPAGDVLGMTDLWGNAADGTTTKSAHT